MKIKQQSNSNDSPIHHSHHHHHHHSHHHGSGHLNYGEQQHHHHHQDDELPAQSQSPTILTRSARAAAAAAASHITSSNKQHKSSTSSLTASAGHNHHHHQHHNSHHHKQHHVVGKIVKPIPVRPVSSSASSTHSSSFSTHHHHHSIVNFISNSLLSMSSQQSNATATTTTQAATATSSGMDNSPAAGSSGNEFSLIAKYFASFPATRLKSTNLNEPALSGHATAVSQSSSSSSPVMLPPPSTDAVVNSKRTPFLPFKKPLPVSTTTSAISSSQNLAPAVTRAAAYNNGLFQSIGGIGCLSSNLVPIDLGVCAQQQTAKHHTDHHPYNLRHYNNHQNGAHTTDHLCTNFKRMIKLNDHNSHGCANDESTASPASPPCSHQIPQPMLHHNPLDANENSESNDSSYTSSVLPNNGPSGNNGLGPVELNGPGQGVTGVTGMFADSANSTGAATSTDSSTRFGQITMETRSTRKFLIKHHPYLQFNQHQHTSTVHPSALNHHPHMHHSSPLSLDQQQPRPSMNLIKMKKLINKANRKLAKQLEESGSSSPSGYHNKPRHQHDHQLNNKSHMLSPLLFGPSSTMSSSNNNNNSCFHAEPVYGSGGFGAMNTEDPFYNHHHNHHHHQQLLKFTDIAPQPSLIAAAAASAAVAASRNVKAANNNIVNSLRNTKQRSSLKLQLQSSSASKLSTSSCFQRPTQSVLSNPNMRTTRTR
jgi:hypothetical protein